jgi:uncharacterized DUF497 family protein
MNVHDLLAGATHFEWDGGNLLKNWEAHGVSASECEQLFFNVPLVAATDERHSQREPRFYALGQTDAGRPLFVVFTIRAHAVRVISARDMNRKERTLYYSS